MTHELTVNKNKGDCEYNMIDWHHQWKLWERNCKITQETDFVITRGECKIPTWELFDTNRKSNFALRFLTRVEAESFYYMKVPKKNNL